MLVKQDTDELTSSNQCAAGCSTEKYEEVGIHTRVLDKSSQFTICFNKAKILQLYEP